ncbi:MAG: twin-arginine translocase TatA/TatE family subunit [Planctomycetota bacterium]|nr:twin-arginine translocase TatA/TatE family subunit [Planctomycetota bacterium]
MTTLAWTIGPWEIAVIVIIAVLLFGRRLPEIGRSLGKALVEFKKGLRGVKDDIEEAANETDDAVSDSNQNKEDNK